MTRATAIEKDWKGPVGETVTLDYEDRHRRRIALEGSDGTAFLLDLADVPDLQDGDAIRLTSGAVIGVRAAPEALMEITGTDALHLARIAWHIGNRHLAAEITESHLRIRSDHVIAQMVRGLGGAVAEITAPFNPEGGAYGGHAPVRGHDHGHGHTHSHDHSHDDVQGQSHG